MQGLGKSLHNEEHREGEDKRRFKIFEFSRVQRQGNGEEQRCEVEGELTDRNLPGSGLESKVEHDLRCDAVDGAVEEPSFDSEGKYGQCEVRGAFEESMRD